MTSISHRLPSILPFAIIASVTTSAMAQSINSRELAEQHPASLVVVKYLRASINRQFDKAAAMIEPLSLKGLHADYVRRVKSAKLMAEEEAMCRAVGQKDAEGVAAMAPSDFYQRYNASLQEKYNVTEEANQKIAATLDLEILGLAQEKPELVHVVVRTKHDTLKAHIENLETISLVLSNGAWLVSLSEKMPKVSPLAAPAVSPKPPQ